MAGWVFWLIIGVAVFVLLKYSSIRYERLWTYFLIAIMIFVLFTFFSVINHNEVDISSFDGFVNGAKIYGGWLVGWAKNTATITGNVVNVDWSGNYSDSNGENVRK